MGIRLGIDVGRENTQISYYTDGMKEPQALSFETVKTAVYKMKNEEKWLTAPEGEMLYSEGKCERYDNLFDKQYEKERMYFIQLVVLKAKLELQEEKFDKICVTAAEADKFRTLDIKQDFLSHGECFAHYCLNMPVEMYRNGTLLLEYDKEQLVVRQMTISRVHNENVAAVDEVDYSDRLSFEMGEEEAENVLMEIAKEHLGKRMMSSIYLTGSMFAEDKSYDNLIKYVCSRGRVFLGQNLFTKGAAYSTLSKNDYTIVTQEHILSNIDIDIWERGTPKIYRIVRFGTPYYATGKSVCFILDNCDKMNIRVMPYTKAAAYNMEVDLTPFVKMENKTARIEVEITFDNPRNGQITIRDKGFGEIAKASNCVVSRQIVLE